MSTGNGTSTLPPDLRERDEDGQPRKKKRKENASTGTSAATIRALTARMFTFYFRAPMKAFFRARIDNLPKFSNPSDQGFARAINPHVKAGEGWSWRMTSPALLAHAVRTYGWGFIPNQVLPPLLANTVIGAVVYTGYLNTLGLLHEPSSRPTRRVYPPPSLHTTFTAGFAAGAIQSLVAAPLDALQVRFQAAEMMQGKYRNMWHYAAHKTREIGVRGVFAGWSLSLVRDSFGFGAFFAAFEFVKGQCFYNFVSTWYGMYDRLSLFQKNRIAAQLGEDGRPEIKPHYMLEPTFLLLAGVAASIAQAVIQHPINRIQEVHYGRLEWVDSHRSSTKDAGKKGISALRMYASAYRKTFKECFALARRAGGMRQWLYADFLMGTLRQVPSTSAGLIVFEVLRRKWAIDEDVVKIHKGGYDILLS